MSVCEGHVQIGAIRYEIKPIANSPTFQHLIYRKRPELRQPCRGGTEAGTNATSEVGDVRIVDGHSPPPPKGRADKFKDAASARYLEYYLVVDKSTFAAHKHNETQLVLIILHMMADVHAIYLPIGLHVYLVGLELWTENDRVAVSGKSLAITLDAFYKFASNELQRHVHFDHAGILTAKGHPSGLARGDSICHYNHASVSAMRTYLNLQNDAENVAHQLGHSLGFLHDDGSTNLARGCDCNCSKEGSCLMVGKKSPECPRLSNCSREVYDDMIRKPGKECLLDEPPKTFRNKECGNEVIEEGEDCDCGLEEDIGEGILSLFMKPNAQPLAMRQQHEEQGESKADVAFRGFSECRRNGCCQDDCKSKPGIDCLFGPCCKNCKFSKEGTVCREAVTECDLPEYCNGTSAECPVDVYKQDGMPCSDSNSCFLGNCLDLHKHCVALFGKDAQEAPLSCFKEVNMRGDQSGNCGGDGEKYKKCDEEDVLCGRLQCVHIKKIPKMSTGQSVIQTPVENTLCWGMEFHLGQDTPDLGAVKDGTTCGTGKICINRSCVDLDFMKHKCTFSKCNHRGVCNNNGNCHCSYGWAPPFCLGKGYGGSIESGPPSYEQPLSRVIGFVVLGVLAFVVIGLIATYKRDPLKAW
nr:disintegrin and metalloproteinase domain-containing protein 9-like [Anolis sagrei ordinatus]